VAGAAPLASAGLTGAAGLASDDLASGLVGAAILAASAGLAGATVLSAGLGTFFSGVGRRMFLRRGLKEEEDVREDNVVKGKHGRCHEASGRTKPKTYTKLVGQK